MSKVIGWNFEHSYAELPDCFFSKALPTPTQKNTLVALNIPLAQELGLNTDALKDPASAEIFVGNTLPEGAQPIAQAYAGHQFGNFTMLGDGRAILLGEHITPAGKRLDVQLKGAGRTKYSRGGDGRAALGPMLREFIVSEALHALGIPTTRSLAVATTGEGVVRERILPGAVLTRIASSHIRVGTFEFAAARDDAASLAALTLYALERHYPDFPEDVPPAYTLLLRVVEAQARLIAQWMLVGFIHGVMNTDNMSVSGESIDFGPCAFMDTYHPNTVFSSIDENGRYAYANQARIALWNLERFATTLLPLLHEDEEMAVELAKDALDAFAGTFNETWTKGMLRKIGVDSEVGERGAEDNSPHGAEAHIQDDALEDADQSLVTELLGIMQKHEWDYTNTFLVLSELLSQDKKTAFQPQLKLGSENAAECAREDFLIWKDKWIARLDQDERKTDRSSSSGEKYQSARKLMDNHNPAVIARNHRMEAALRAAEMGDFAPFERLLHVLRDPFGDTPEHNEFAKPPAQHERVLHTFCGT